VTDGLGFTVIENVLFAPLHVIPPPVYCDKTEIVDVMGVVPELLATNEFIFPVPDAARPIEVVLLFHV
jgi:hypothetical protein